jgi:hypothetical protein
VEIPANEMKKLLLTLTTLLFAPLAAFSEDNTMVKYIGY